MKHKNILFLVLLLLAATSCVFGNEVETEGAAGFLTPERDFVVHGSNSRNLEPLLIQAPFFEGDILSVTDGGQALMEIGTSLWMRLFNNTTLEVVYVEANGDIPLDVKLDLVDGGVTGELVQESGQVQLETPNGVTVTIRGTAFFVGYNPTKGETTVVNFDGDVRMDDGSSTINLPFQNYVTIPAGAPTPIRPVSLDQIEDAIRRARTPVEAVSFLACPNFDRVSLTAEKGNDFLFVLTWQAFGGCGPFKGTVTGTYSELGETFVTYEINEPGGFFDPRGGFWDRPPLQCEGTFTITYEIILRDSLGNERTDKAEGEIVWNC